MLNKFIDMIVGIIPFDKDIVKKYLSTKLSIPITIKNYYIVYVLIK